MITDAIVALAEQPECGWTQKLDLRPAGDAPFQLGLVAARSDEWDAAFCQLPHHMLTSVAAGPVEDDLRIGHGLAPSMVWMGTARS
ncbi:hypothetical protein [Novosphingobium lentum]|uniref:hypothetical protein n=1 Tax=Novosphingobium lentum TaxID=145287 RepID=UPI000AA17A41|nr:hypothetical protein [Novosphingobium lentum]